MLQYPPVPTEPVIFDLKQSVFDLPVSPEQGQGSLRRQGRQAAHPVLHTVPFPTGPVIPHCLAGHEHAGWAQKIDITRRFLRHPDLVPLSPIMTLAYRSVPRSVPRWAGVGENQGYILMQLGPVLSFTAWSSPRSTMAWHRSASTYRASPVSIAKCSIRSGHLLDPGLGCWWLVQMSPQRHLIQSHRALQAEPACGGQRSQLLTVFPNAARGLPVHGHRLHATAPRSSQLHRDSNSGHKRGCVSPNR